MADLIPASPMPTVLLLVASTSLKWLETNNLFNNLIQRNQSAAFSSGKVRPNHETNINIIARRTGKDVNRHTANQTSKKFMLGIKSNISTNRNNLISGVDRCIHLNAMKKTTITSINRQTIKIYVDDVALGVCKTGAE